MATKSRDMRIADVQEALAALPAALKAARAAERAAGAEAPPLAAWEEVERLGAIIHRQSRLLAGKARGG